MTILSDLKRDVQALGIKRNQIDPNDPRVDIVNYLQSFLTAGDPNYEKYKNLLYNALPPQYKTNTLPSPSRIQWFIEEATDNQIKAWLQAIQEP